MTSSSPLYPISRLGCDALPTHINDASNIATTVTIISIHVSFVTRREGYISLQNDSISAQLYNAPKATKATKADNAAVSAYICDIHTHQHLL